MILFSTRSTRHIAKNMALQQGAATIKQFRDGELFVRIDQDVQDKNVWILAGTQPPAENLLELFFLCDALLRAGAQINLFVTYLAYVRQIIAAPGEACAAQVIASMVKNFPVKQICILHPHSNSLHDFLPFTAMRDMDFFCKQAAEFDAIAAPDKGAVILAQDIAKSCNKELIFFTKTHPEKELVEIVSVNGNATGKKVLLVDDMISTGQTITECAHTLKKMGAKAIGAAITHGIFSPGAEQLLEQSPIQKLSVTNSIAQTFHPKVTVVDISTFIQKSILLSD